MASYLVVARNKKDIEDIPKNIASQMEIIPVSEVSEIFSLAIRDIDKR